MNDNYSIEYISRSGTRLTLGCHQIISINGKTYEENMTDEIKATLVEVMSRIISLEETVNSIIQGIFSKEEGKINGYGSDG